MLDQKQLEFTKERVLFSGTPNERVVRTLDTRLDFFRFQELCRNSQKPPMISIKTNEMKGQLELLGKPISNLILDKALVRDIINKRRYNFLLSKNLPKPYLILTSTFFVASAPGKKIGNYFKKFIPLLNADLIVEVPKRARDNENIAVVIDNNCFDFIRNTQGEYILTLDRVNDVIWQYIPEEGYGECCIDMRTGLPNPKVSPRYKGPKRRFLRDIKDEIQIGAVLRDSGEYSFDLIDLTYDLSLKESELKKYKSVWVPK